MSKILLTGSSGFIGSHLLKHFLKKKQEVVALVRKETTTVIDLDYFVDLDYFEIESFDSKTNYSEMPGCDIVVHCSGIAHENVELNRYLEVNYKASVHLAREAFNKGMKRFVFISTIGVTGRQSTNRISETNRPAPFSDYAISKYKAEVELSNLAKLLGFELVIIRPPLVYGEGAKGSFDLLMKLVSKAPILPFGLINNSRSFISINNLVSVVFLSMYHPKAAGEVFVVSDDASLSTKEITTLIASALGKRVFQLPIPPSFLKGLFKIIGKGTLSLQLIHNLELDCRKVKSILGWIPVESTEQALNKMASTNFRKE